MTSTPTRIPTGRTGSGPRAGRCRALGRATAALALVLTASVVFLAAPTPGPAAAQVPPVTGAACAPGQGVTVVVDFNGLPGGIRVGCAPGVQANGLAALVAAGFTVGMGEAPGVVCTIEGAPTEGYPFCWLTGGYWSYWRAPLGGSWAFSPVGAGGGPLPVDRVEGWSWAPGFASRPPRANETSAPPTPTTTSSSTTSTPAGTASTSTTATSTASTPPGSAPTSQPPATNAPPTSPATTGTAPATAPGAAGAGGGAGLTSGAEPARSATAPASLARTGSDTRAATRVALVLLLLGAVLVATSRRLAAARR